MSDLLPCPFCGDRLVQRYAGWFDHPKSKCILSGRAFHKGWIGQWNKRADLPRPQDAARIAELEAALERIAAMDRRSNYRCGDLSRPMHVDGPIGKIARASLAADSGAADA